MFIKINRRERAMSILEIYKLGFFFSFVMHGLFIYLFIFSSSFFVCEQTLPVDSWLVLI